MSKPRTKASTTPPLFVAYQDFDGVFHGPVYRHQTPPRMRLGTPGHSLLEYSAILETLLAPYPTVKLVLSTAWVWTVGFEEARDALPPNLRARVIGSTFDPRGAVDARSFGRKYRFDQIIQDVRTRRPQSWIAIDDSAEGWPAEHALRLVKTDTARGLSDLSAQELLRERLALHFGNSEGR